MIIKRLGGTVNRTIIALTFVPLLQGCLILPLPRKVWDGPWAIEGKVVDSITGDPIEGVRVTGYDPPTDPASSQAVIIRTDRKGRFRTPANKKWVLWWVGFAYMSVATMGSSGNLAFEHPAYKCEAFTAGQLHLRHYNWRFADSCPINCGTIELDPLQ